MLKFVFGIACDQNGPVWDRLRNTNWKYISASEVPTIMDMNPHLSRKKIFEKKVDSKRTCEGKPPLREENPEIFCSSSSKKKTTPPLNSNSTNLYINPAILHGRINEDFALQWYQENLISNRFILRPGTITNSRIFTGCSPDALIVFPKSNALDIGLEIKCPWKRKIPYQVDEIYEEHLVQCVASSIALIGLGPWEHEWRLMYYRREYDKNTSTYLEDVSIFDIVMNREGADVVANEIAKFLHLVETENYKEGLRSKKAKSKGSKSWCLHNDIIEFKRNFFDNLFVKKVYSQKNTTSQS